MTTIDRALTDPLPPTALSVRQPWAWAIIHAGKDIENRSRASIAHMPIEFCTSIAIHAAKGMTRDEYEDAASFMATIGILCPRPAELLRGGIIGSASVVGVVKESASKWFFGPRGIVLANQVACPFITSVGALGLFKWRPTPGGAPAQAARWMQPRPAAAEPPPSLFGGEAP